MSVMSDLWAKEPVLVSQLPSIVAGVYVVLSLFHVTPKFSPADVEAGVVTAFTVIGTLLGRSQANPSKVVTPSDVAVGTPPGDVV